MLYRECRINSTHPPDDVASRKVRFAGVALHEHFACVYICWEFQERPDETLPFRAREWNCRRLGYGRRKSQPRKHKLEGTMLPDALFKMSSQRSRKKSEPAS